MPLHRRASRAHSFRPKQRILCYPESNDTSLGSAHRRHASLTLKSVFAAPRGASPSEERRRLMGNKVYVIGVGMTKFEKPGSKAWDYPDMAKEAGENALKDAGIPYGEVEQAVVG